MPEQSVISTKDHAFEDSQALSPVLQKGRYFICSKSLSPHHSSTYANVFQETKGKKPMEDLGGDYFRDLLNRSFFQKSSRNESLFVMHDLMNDLAMWAAGDLCCRLEDQLGGSKQSEISSKLRCLPRGLHELCHLKEIDIYECNSLISLGDLLPTNLRSLEIRDCEKLEALPKNMHNLNFLQDLSIGGFPSIVSFPEEGFPTNVREVRLSGANLCKQIFELGLHRLTSLTSLFIADGIMDSFPEEEDGKTILMLPTSLTTLTLWRFPNLLFLSWEFFQNLSTLEQIFIGACPKLASLSEKCFPPSLQRFHIYECPVLKQNCKKDKGIMWSKIAKIPSVEID